MKNFRKWNREGSDKIIKIQDKSARLVIDSKERIIQETDRTLNDGKTFRKEEDNPTKDHIKKVKEWRNKWIEVFDDDEAIWLLNNEAKPTEDDRKKSGKARSRFCLGRSRREVYLLAIVLEVTFCVNMIPA